MQQDKTFLGTEPVGQLLRRLAIPTVIAQLVNMLYNIVDRIYIGHIPEVGSAALTGVGVCLPIILIVSAFACFTASGGAPRASIYMGRDDMDSAEKTLGGCFTMQIGISVVLTAALLLWGRDALLAFGASENTLGYAADYLHIDAFGTLFVELTLGMNAFITAQGFAKVGMYTVLIGAAANIILDPVFIFALGMGVRGAAFVLIYVACVLLIGFVTMLSEIYLGRRAQANPMTAYKMIHKNLGWCGLVAIVIPAFIICYYSVLGGWTTKYALNSFSGNAGIVGTFSVNTGEVILYTAIFLVLSMVIIMGGVKDGIEKASKVLMPVLFLILVAIAVYALTLGSGVREGLSFYLKPDFSGITFKSVLVAMGQAFYSLSLGMGIMITYGSYTGKEVNLVRSTAMICIFDTLVALIAGLAIFPSVAHFDPALLGSSKGVALMFIILPQVFESMGGVGQVVSFAFFVMVDIAAITSVVSLIEVVTQFVIQKFHAHRKRAALIVAGVCFLVSIPIGISLGHVAILEESSPALFGLDWLTFFDEVTNTVLMPVCALFSCIVVGWFITPKRAVAEIEAGGTPMSGWLKKVYAVMIRFVTPALILIVEIGGLQSEIAAGNVAVVVFAYALVALCVVAYFAFFRNRDTGTNADEKLSGDYPV